MTELFARYLTPLTYLMWVMIVLGMIDHFAVEFLPRQVADVNLYVMWPVLAIVWFGHKHKAREKAQAMRDNMSDGA
jgi:amino acid permease